MEDIEINWNHRNEDKNKEKKIEEKIEKKMAQEPDNAANTSIAMNMTVSPVCQKNGRKIAYVSFVDGDRVAEGEIPACKITMSKGFTETEVEQLQDYMKRELTNLKKMAAGINVLDAFLGRKR